MPEPWWRVVEVPGNLDAPGDWLGFVRRWTARSVDIAAAEAAGTWLRRPAVEPGAGEGPSEDEEKRPASLQGARRSAVVDELALRLLAALRLPLDRLVRPNGPLDWPAPFLPYQAEGIRALVAAPSLLLADDMGLGKTVQAAAALRALLHAGRVARALVVAPAGLLLQWRRELRKWAPELRVMLIRGQAGEREWKWRHPAHVTLVSYETLRSDVSGPAPFGPARIQWDLVVLDEASRVKNRETELSAAVMRLPRRRRWALTGTPLENRMEDVFSILEFLEAEPGQRGWHAPSGTAVRERLRGMQLRRRKQDVLSELPPKRINEVPLALPDEQWAAYARAEQEGVVHLVEAGEAVTVTHVLELIVRLKQLCNFDPSSGRSGKLEDIAERLVTLVDEGHRALVFSQFVDDVFGVGRLARHLRDFRPLQVTGGMAPDQRAATIDRFVEDPSYKVLLLSLRAGGLGLNLQAASYVFHLDRWWNPAIEDQAESRAHRLGQPYPVNVYRYVCSGTIEERIDRTLRQKRRLFQEVVDDVTLDLSTAFSESELFGLFGLTPPGAHGS